MSNERELAEIMAAFEKEQQDLLRAVKLEQQQEELQNRIRLDREREYQLQEEQVFE
jgi:hypothetical protein